MKSRTIDRIDDMPLPQLCNTQGAFALVVMAELIAIVVASVRSALHPDPWLDFAFCSVYIQLTALSCGVALCHSQRRLIGYQMRTILFTLFCVAMVVSVAVGEFCYRIMVFVGVNAFADRPSHLELLFRSATLTFIVVAVALRYGYIAQEWRRQIEAKQEARTQALQAMIRPHFLFNSLNTIASLTRSDPVAAERSVEDLADLFRASLSNPDAMTTLNDEIAITKRYQEIEQHRLGDRLKTAWDVEPFPDDIQVPKLMLQPLFENAIYHGIQPLAEGGTIRVSVHNRADYLYIAVENAKPENSRRGKHSGNKMAQENLRRRIKLAYNGRGVFKIEDDNQTYRVVLQIPTESETNDEIDDRR